VIQESLSPTRFLILDLRLLTITTKNIGRRFTVIRVDYAKNFFLDVSAGFVESLNVIIEGQKIRVASSYLQQHREESHERSVFPHCSMFYTTLLF
jgi:hypothetical protein